MKSFLQIHKTKIELLTFNSKILLHLSYHKNGIGGSLTFHESKLHVINLNLLPNSVLKNPFYNFHSMFQQFDYSIRSTRSIQAGTRKVKPIWILLKQETVSGSGISWASASEVTTLWRYTNLFIIIIIIICKSASRYRQITMPVPHH